MAKKKAQLYEELEFDEVQYAVDVYNESKKKREKIKKGLFIATIATICNLYGQTITALWSNSNNLTDLQQTVGGIGLILAIVAYIMGGGILTALKWSGRIATYVFIIFIFPLNLILSAGALALAFMAFLCIPVIFVFMNYRQVDLNYKAAKKYISYFKATQAKQQQVSQSTPITQNTSQTNYVRTQTTQSRNQTYQTQNRSYGTSSTSYSNRGTSSYRTGNQSRSQSNQNWR